MTTPPEDTPKTAPELTPAAALPEASSPVERTDITLSDRPTIGQLLEALLKAPATLADHLATQSRSTNILLGLALICTAGFGLLLGTYSGGTQLWAAPIKVAGGLAFAALICFPSLYIFASLDGIDTRLTLIFRKLVAAVAVIGLLLVSFAPVVWIFAQSTDAIGLIGCIVIIVWIISLAFGLQLLGRLLRGEAKKAGHYRMWCAIFVLVTFQMSTALRPILGTADTIFPQEKRFFLEHWFKASAQAAVEADAQDYSN